MHEDKLTHAQRLRLEAFAQASAGRFARGDTALELLQGTFQVACLIEQWLWAADEVRETPAGYLGREARKGASSY